MLIYYQNVNRLRSKTKEFYLNVLNNDYDIICITETNLNSAIFDGEFIDTRYNVVRRDRYQSNARKSEGGGILIAVKKEINFIYQASWNSELEDLWISILPKATNVKIINICLCYLPPDLPLDCIDKFFTNCQNVIMRYRNTEEFLCIGDFNIPDVHWSKSSQYNYMIPLHPRGHKANLLCDTLRICDLDNYNSISNNNGRFLDLILFSSNSIQVYEVEPLSRLDNHHPSLVADINLVEINSNNFKNKKQKRPNFFKSNYSKINLELKSVKWHNILSIHKDIDSMTDAFYAELRNIIAKHTPMTKIDTNNYPVWFSPALRQSLEEKLKYHRRFKKYKNPRDYDTFSMLRKRCKKLISNDYKNFVSSVESSLDDDIKFFWRFVNDKKNNANSIPKTMKYGNHISSDEKEICELFSNYFSSVFANPEETILYSHNELSNRSNCTLSDIAITQDDIQQKIVKLDQRKGSGPDDIPPLFIKKCGKELSNPLCIIFNASIKAGIFPSVWKIAHIVPIYKSGDRSNCENYRPVSILSCLGKLFESLVYDSLYHHI